MISGGIEKRKHWCIEKYSYKEIILDKQCLKRHKEEDTYISSLKAVVVDKRLMIKELSSSRQAFDKGLEYSRAV